MTMFRTEFPTTAKRLTGWGRTAPTVAQVLTTPDPEVIVKAVTRAAEDPELLVRIVTRAIAAAVWRAVPEGASTLSGWCSSTISALS